METMDIINNIIKITFINICTYMLFIKLINYKYNNFKKTIIIFIASLSEELLGIILTKYIDTLIGISIMYLLHTIVIAKITRNNFQYSLVVTLISLTITYIVYIISIILTGIITNAFYPNIPLENTAILYVIMIIESLILYFSLKIRRFKNGLPFLQNTEKVNNIGLVGFALIGATMLIYSTLGIYKFVTYLIIGIIIEAICITIWIRRKITKYYKQKLKERTIAELEAEISEKDEEINKITEENRKIATINHKYSNRIQALEKFSQKIKSNSKIMESMKTEFGEEFGDFAEQIKRLSEEYTNEMEEIIKHEETLEKTGIFGIDNILEYMKEEANKNNIKFNLKVNGNINYMVENIIEQSKLETLLGDHIKDAIIAINSSNSTYKSILVIIGIIDNCYEVSIYDTGIEFEIDTLLKLGTEATTTHKETGGTGIGFMTTFETLKSTKASLIIEEKHPMNNTDYTKSVNIRFDGKNEYKICSYRADEIRKKNNSRKILIESV